MQREGQVRIPSGCAISGVFSKSRERMSGRDIVDSIAIMHDRSNGLGGGFAAYGIYPEYRDAYAFHLFYDDTAAQRACEDMLKAQFIVLYSDEIPTRKTKGVTDVPLIRRYFLTPDEGAMQKLHMDERSYVAHCVMRIHADVPGAFVFSSGKDVGVFKGIGFPEDVGEFYRLEEYSGYSFTAHGRYPTNTPGWWGGAHPFALLDTTVVHNGEISSYDANRRTVEMYGYKCALLTDTEVIAYMIDYLVRRQGLAMEEAASVIAAPFWSTIERMEEPKRSELTYLRSAFSSFLITGPFSILVGFTGGLMALNDRLKLRSMVVGERGDRVYIASEESAIRRIAPELDRLYAPKGGEPVVVRLQEEE